MTCVMFPESNTKEYGMKIIYTNVYVLVVLILNEKFIDKLDNVLKASYLSVYCLFSMNRNGDLHRYINIITNAVVSL